MKTYEELIDQVTDRVHDHVTNDDDTYEELVQDYAVELNIFSPDLFGKTQWLADREAERLVAFEEQVTRDMLVMLAARLLADADTITRRIWEQKGSR